MSRALTQLTVFVSGTSEADAEKAAVRRVVEEISKLLEKTHAVTLRVLAWPDDFRPGVNADPQAEINRQLALNYDIYVGLLGSRFGTPTQRAGSGTEEEFEDALARFLANHQALRLLFYFKRSTADPFSIDVDQLQRVKRFREGLASRGVLYRDFQDTTDFVEQVKRHLYELIVEEWNNDSWNAVEISAGRSPKQSGSVGKSAEASGESTAPSAVGDALTRTNEPRETSAELAPAPPADVDETELGFLEYVEGFHEAVASLTETLERFANTTTTMNERVVAKTAETESLRHELERGKHVGGSRLQQEYASKAKKAVDEAAAALDEYAAAMTSDVERFRGTSRAMFDNLRFVLDSGAEFGSDAARSQENRDALTRLIEAMEKNRQLVSDFQTTIRQTPALTGRFKRARQRTASMLGELIAEVSFFIEEGKRVLAHMGTDGRVP